MTATGGEAERPTLELVQRFVWKLLTAPEGVAPGAAALESSGETPPGRIDDWFVGDERRDATGRLDIYANMYFFRLRDSVREDFPKSALLLGDARFHDLMTDYLLVHPSAHASLRFAGERLPGFLRAHRFGLELPFVSDLAALEWARGDVFQMVDSPVLDRASLAAIAPEAWQSLTFTPGAALRLVEAGWEVSTLWEKLEAEGEDLVEAVRQGTESVAHEPESILVYREDEDAVHEVLSPVEAIAVRALLAGSSFADLCEALAQPTQPTQPSPPAPCSQPAAASGPGGERPDVDAAANVAAGLLSRWLDRGLLSGYRV